MKPIEGIEHQPQSKVPDVERVPVPDGELCIIADWCKGCGFCVEFCPRHVLVSSEAFNRKGYHPPKVVNPESCKNCDLCEMICPDFAIFTVGAPGAEPDEESGGTR